jgi:hypothetical protein
VQCIACKAELGRKPRAAIAVLVAGDERIHSWFWCSRCGVYTCEHFHDRFMGESDVHVFGPIDADEGERILALVAACPDPSDKFCSCPSHSALLHGRA